MIYMDRFIAAIQYSEGLKEKKGISDIRFWYRKNPEIIEEEINKYLVSNKIKTEILIEKIKYFFLDMRDRGMSDNMFHHIICKILDVLEPPNCQKSHCQYYTTSGFCNCSEGRVPGKCKEHREYLDRKAKRENKTPGKYFPGPGSRVTIITTSRVEQTGVIGQPEERGGKWYFPFLVDGYLQNVEVCVDEINSIKVIKNET